MSGETVRAVSLGERKAWDRMASLAQETVNIALESEDREFRRDAVTRGLSAHIAIEVANAARNEGVALTWQVSRPGGGRG